MSSGPAPLAVPARKPRRGDELVLRIERFDERGRGVARHGEQRVRLRHVLPGDLVRARVLRRRRDEVEAVLIEKLEHGTATRAARCEHFGSCGGCSFQDLEYAAQLQGLRELVRDAFDAHAALAGAQVEAVRGADDPWHYRNKMEFTFSDRRWVDPREPKDAPAAFALGLHASAMYTKVIDIGACSIQDPRADRILASARELALAQGLAPWSVREHTGILRHLVVRTARATGEMLVNLVTADAPRATIDGYAAALLERHPEITTFVHNVNTRLASTAVGERERVLHGPGVLRDRLAGLTFAISANSFFQTNTAQAELLFTTVLEECALAGDELVYDLYCGTGSIALVLARHAREVLGIEQAPSSIADAQRNASLNAITNARFIAADVLAWLASDDGRAGPRPDVCVVDPPRAGLHPRVPARLLELLPRRLVYVSCNPRTAASDVELLTRGPYRVERIRPIDLFPHTPHVECVISLARTDGEAAAR